MSINFSRTHSGHFPSDRSICETAGVIMKHGSTESHSQTDTTGLKQWVLFFWPPIHYSRVQSLHQWSSLVRTIFFFFLVGCFSPLDSTRQVDYFVSYVLRSSRSGSGMCAFLTYWTAFRFFYFFFTLEVILSILVRRLSDS